MGAATLAMNIPRLGGRTRSPIFPISKGYLRRLRVVMRIEVSKYGEERSVQIATP